MTTTIERTMLTLSLHGTPYGRDGESAGECGTAAEARAIAERILHDGQELRVRHNGRELYRFAVDEDGRVVRIEA